MSSGVQPVPAFSPTQSQLAVAYSVCRGIARSSAKNFYYAFLALPKSKRQALCAVYAFMRRCDDISDDASLPLDERRQKLADWLDAFHRAYAGEPTDDPVLLALTNTQQRFLVPLGLLDELAYGTAMDIQADASPLGPVPSGQQADLTVHYRTFGDLYQYCYKVASVVGLVCIRIFGYHNPEAEPLAERCGVAFQLTNIIRDVREDAAMGRIYLPGDDLEKFEIAPSELQAGSDASHLAPLLALEADRAREYYASGDALIPYVDEDSQPALWVLITIYRRLLEKIAAKHYDVFSERISLSAREKLVVLGKGLLRRLV